MVTEGVQIYDRLQREGSVEHMSAEEVLQQNAPEYPLQLLDGGVRQGMVSTNPSESADHPLGFQTILRFCQTPDRWVAAVITKTPETVVVCLPPLSGGSAPVGYVLLDSHPRPQLGAENAYGKTHESLEELCVALQAIFPATDLGPDIPEMMAMMYNSFDLYPLVLK